MTATVAGATRLLRTFAHHQHVHMIDALHDGGAERVTTCISENINTL